MNGLELPWARHSQPVYLRRAHDERYDYWLRVAFLALGTHGVNGHAMFGRGDVAVLLGRPGRPHRNVKRAIDQAVAMEWLIEGSYWGCLIVPPEAVKSGELREFPPCPRCERRKKRMPKSTPGVDLGLPKSTPGVDLGIPKSTPGVAFERGPLLSICSPATHPGQEVAS